MRMFLDVSGRISTSELRKPVILMRCRVNIQPAIRLRASSLLNERVLNMHAKDLLCEI